MSNYPAGVTDADIDNLMGGDEPETDDVIVPADILDRLIEDAEEDMNAEGLRVLEAARAYLLYGGRLDNTGRWEIATERFLVGCRERFGK